MILVLIGQKKHADFDFVKAAAELGINVGTLAMRFRRFKEKYGNEIAGGAPAKPAAAGASPAKAKAAGKDRAVVKGRPVKRKREESEDGGDGELKHEDEGEHGAKKGRGRKKAKYEESGRDLEEGDGVEERNDD